MNVPVTAVRPLATRPADRPSPTVPRRHAPGVAKLAAFRSPETDRLGHAVGFPLVVLRVVDDAERHARVLSETWHGCWRASDPGWFMPFDYDYASPTSARFERLTLDPRWMGATALPTSMTFSDGCVAVALPPGVSRSDLGQAFGQAMIGWRFDEVARRPARVRQRFATGRPTNVASRYAAPPVTGCDGRVRPVEDLYHFRPRALPLVIGALEASSRILAMCSALAVAATSDD